MGNLAFAAEGTAKTAKLALTGKQQECRIVHIVGHVRGSDNDASSYRRVQIWVEADNDATLGWVLSRVIEEMDSREPELPNIVGLRVLRRGANTSIEDDDTFLANLADELLLDYGEAIETVLGKGDGLECLFQVPTNACFPCSLSDDAAIEVPDEVGLGHFSIVRTIGTGATSRVLQVCHNGNGHEYAIKVMNKRKLMQDERTVQRIMREKRILAKLSHPFVVSLHWAFQTDGHLFLVLDYCAGGELFYHFQRLGAFSEVDSRFYVSEIVIGLEYLHKLNILYRDLKLENCLLDIEGHVRLTDFGLSKDNVCETDNYSFVGTLSYISPEMLRKEGHGLPLDFYCLGCLLYLLLTERVPHETRDLHKMYAKRMKGATIPLPEGSTKEVGNLLYRLLDPYPADRLRKADAVKRHRWFRHVDFDKVLDRVPQPVFPSFPPINPALQLGQNFDPALNDELGQSFCHGGCEAGMIAGFSKMG